MHHTVSIYYLHKSELPYICVVYRGSKYNSIFPVAKNWDEKSEGDLLETSFWWNIMVEEDHS